MYNKHILMIHVKPFYNLYVIHYKCVTDSREVVTSITRKYKTYVEYVMKNFLKTYTIISLRVYTALMLYNNNAIIFNPIELPMSF